MRRERASGWVGGKRALVLKQGGAKPDTTAQAATIRQASHAARLYDFLQRVLHDVRHKSAVEINR